MNFEREQIPAIAARSLSLTGLLLLCLLPAFTAPLGLSGLALLLVLMSVIFDCIDAAKKKVRPAAWSPFLLVFTGVMSLSFFLTPLTYHGLQRAKCHKAPAF